MHSPMAACAQRYQVQRLQLELFVPASIEYVMHTQLISRAAKEAPAVVPEEGCCSQSLPLFALEELASHFASTLVLECSFTWIIPK